MGLMDALSDRPLRGAAPGLSRRVRLGVLAFTCALLAVACAPATRPSPRAVKRVSQPRAVVRRVPEPYPQPQGLLYTAEEALRDALSGRWEFLGTGPWHGNARMHACVFRNRRVFIVNVYCTLTDRQALRVDIFSPQRGRIRLYAEGPAPISAQRRQRYFTFTAESEPPAAGAKGLPQVSLGMNFGVLADYDRQRYEAYLPSCFAGEELSRERHGCLGALRGQGAGWAADNHAFLTAASADWYRLVRELRAAALRYGRDPP